MRGLSSGAGRLRWYRFRGDLWYRTGFFSGVLTLGAVALLYSGVTDASLRLEAASGAMLGAVAVWVLVAGLRSGIGVGAEGVTVRSALGWSRRVPWQEVVGFQAVRPSAWVVSSSVAARAVAVVCRDRRPLTTAGCYFTRSSKKSGFRRVDEMLRALEAERVAAGMEPPSSEVIL
jgi:hypothetical protein